MGLEFTLPSFTIDISLPIVAGFEMKTGEPTASADVGVDVDGVAEIEWVMRGFLGSVAADHDFAGLVRERSAEFFMNEGERVLFGGGDVVLKVGVDEDVSVGFVIGLGVA